MSKINELSFNHEIILLSSATRSASVNSDDQVNDGYRGVVLFLSVTAESATGTLDVKVQVKDFLSGSYIDLAGAAFAQATSVSTAMLTIFPGVAETNNVSVSDVLPRGWRIVATQGGSGTLTYSVTGCYIA